MSYSPTQTARYRRCPTKWYLTREGWTPRAVYKNRIAAVAGQAFHAWAEQYYHSGRKEISPLVAQAAFDSGIEELREHGHEIYADDELRQYPAYLEEGIKQYPKNDPIPNIWELLAFEDELGDGSRMDLGGRNQYGTPFCLDFKTTMWCKPDDIQKRLNEYLYSWQCYHYADKYGKKLGEPVKQFHIALVVFRPVFTVVLQTFEIEPEVMEWWRKSADLYWIQMSKMEDWPIKNIPMDVEHHDKWGKCEFYDFCFKYGREESLADAAYIKIDRPKTGGLSPE